MCSLHGNLLLIWPRSTEFPLRTAQKSSWIPIHEQLWYRAGRKPARIGIHNFNDIFRLPLYRQLSRPCQHWLAQRPGGSIMAAINLHCVLGDTSERQEVFYEKILLKDQCFPGWRALRLEEFSRRLWPCIPRKERPDNRLHVNKCLDSLGMALSP